MERERKGAVGFLERVFSRRRWESRRVRDRISFFPKRGAVRKKRKQRKRFFQRERGEAVSQRGDPRRRRKRKRKERKKDLSKEIGERRAVGFRLRGLPKEKKTERPWV